MKIAFFADTFRPNIDGVVTAMANLEEGLKKQGHKTEYFVPAPQKKEDELQGVHYAKSFAFPPYPQYRVVYDGRNIERECEKFNPAAIHCHAMATMAVAARTVAKKQGIPLVGTFHTMLPDAVHYITKNQGLQEWGVHLTWNYLAWLYRDFDVVTSPSEYVKGLLLRHGIESVVVPGGIDTKKFTPGKLPGEIKEWFEFDGGKFLFVGRVVKEKNIDYILELAKSKAWKEGNCRAYIVGEGPYKKEFEAKVAAAKAAGKIGRHSIFFEGRVARHVLVGFYRAADVFLFPSKFETQGLVALEALACGTPVAAFMNTAAGELVGQGKNGALLGADDSYEDATRKIIGAAHAKKKMAAHCRKVALKFDLVQYSKSVEKIYKRLQ